jgi:hypothetical protein
MYRKDLLIDKFIYRINERDYNNCTFRKNQAVEDLKQLRGSKEAIHIYPSIFEKVFNDFKVESYIEKLSDNSVKYKKMPISREDGPVTMYINSNACLVVYLDFAKLEINLVQYPLSKYFEYMASVQRLKEKEDSSLTSEVTEFSTDQHDISSLFKPSKELKQSKRKSTFEDLLVENYNDLFN